MKSKHLTCLRTNIFDRELSHLLLVNLYWIENMRNCFVWTLQNNTRNYAFFFTSVFNLFFKNKIFGNKNCVEDKGKKRKRKIRMCQETAITFFSFIAVLNAFLYCLKVAILTCCSGETLMSFRFSTVSCCF